MSEFLSARDPAAEADAVLGDGSVGAVLEPSPVVDDDPDYLADDPIARGGGAAVSPLDGSNRRWLDVVADRPELHDFAADRWLIPGRALGPLPDGFAATRLDLHRLASQVISPARRQAIGKMGLRFTARGFGTPFFPADDGLRQVRVVATDDGASIIDQHGDRATIGPVTTLHGAAELVGVGPDTDWASQHDIPAPGPLDADLRVDLASARALADWFGFAWSVLEQLRSESASVDASRPQLWPEHFDPAIELGSDAAQQRGSYGFSPGDVTKDAAPGAEPLPYVYVGPWYPDRRPDSDYWNGEGFPGAVLRYDDIVAADDPLEQRELVLAFLRKGRSLLGGDR